MFTINFFATSSGGSGLLTRPFFFFITGAPLAVATATCHVSHLGSLSTSMYALHKSGKLRIKESLRFAVGPLLASALGAYVVVNTPDSILKSIVGVVLITMAFVILVKDNLHSDKPVRIPRDSWFYYVFMNINLFFSRLIGIVAGGGGIISALVFVFIDKQSFTQATADRKVISASTAFITIPAFIYAGLVEWQYVITLLLASTSAGWFGMRFAIKQGEEYIKRLIIIALIITGLSLLLL